MILERPGKAGSRIRRDRLEPEQGGISRIGARAIAVEHDDATLAYGEPLGASVGIEDDGVAIRLPRELTRRGGRRGAADQGTSDKLETAVLASQPDGCRADVLRSARSRVRRAVVGPGVRPVA